MNLPTFASLNLGAALPLLFLATWVLVVLLADLFIPKTRKYWTAWLSVLGLAATGALLLLQTGPSLPTGPAFVGMLTVDVFSVFLQLPLSLGLALLLNRKGLRARNFFRLVFFSPHLVGMVFVAVTFPKRSRAACSTSLTWAGVRKMPEADRSFP